MFENTREGFWANNPARNPRHWRNRGWHNDIECYEIGPGLKFDMPLALFWTAVSGHETPAAKDLGGTLLNPKIPWEVDWWPVSFSWRDGWIAVDDSSRRRNTTIPYYRPAKPMPAPSTRMAAFMMMRAPFPITLDTSLTTHSTCSLGHIDDPPYLPPYTGNPSRQMVNLMNAMPMKPGYIIWDGWLHVWVNYLYWQLASQDPDFKQSMSGVPVALELVLFRAYRAYYEQLRQELPLPYRGPIVWPDQCDPRFPMPGDRRYSLYV